jgi:hypothetical protein
MEKIIKIGNIVIYEKLCMIDFWVESSIGRKDMTHSELYNLLVDCDQWKVRDTSGFITFWHGKIEVTAFVKERATRAYFNPELVETNADFAV